MKDNNNSLAVPNLHIPPEAVEAAARTIASDDGWPLGWEDYMDTATAAIRAALAAWPGMQRHTFPPSGSGDDYCPAIDEIILPLTTENPDAEA